MTDEREVSLDEVYQMAVDSKDTLLADAVCAGHDNIKIYLHWTAGWYTTHYTDDYHLSIDDEGKIYTACESLSELLSHTWHRNSGAVAVTLCCCVGATTSDLGYAPPTVKQVEMMARVIACLTDAFNLPINTQTVLTHGEAADILDGDIAGYGYNDAYGCLNGCERWDLQYLGTPDSPEYIDDYADPATGGNIIRGKANWYRQYGYK